VFKNKVKREPLTDTNLLLRITIMIFIVMYILAILIWQGGFLKPQQFIDLFNLNSFLIIVACGMTIVMITGGIDISVGGVTALVTMCCIVYLDGVLSGTGGTVLGSVLLALAIGLFFGAMQGFLVAYMDIQPFIVSLAGMFFARGMTTIIYSKPLTVQQEAFVFLQKYKLEIPWKFLGSYGRNGNFIPARIELEALIALAVVLIIYVVLRWTKFGRNLYAIGGNPQSALMLGINVKKTRFFAYVLCGVLAGIGGYAYILQNGAANPAGDAVAAEMKAIASAIIGGTMLLGGVGNVIGTLFGTLTLLTINMIVVTSGLTKPWWQSITTGAMLCFFILLQSVVLSQRHRRRLTDSGESGQGEDNE